MICLLRAIETDRRPERRITLEAVLSNSDAYLGIETLSCRQNNVTELTPKWGRTAVKIRPVAHAGESAMAYDLDQFIADCRSTLSRDPSPAGRELVRQNLETLLANKDFVEKHCGGNVQHGLKVLYEDPKLGFQILAHINDKARVSPPHDHGASWAIYGQATKYTDMTEWEREDDGKDPKHAKLKPIKKYRLTPGKAGIYQNGAIHSIDYPDHACFVRVTGTNLDKIDRIKIDPKTGTVEKMYPLQATQSPRLYSWPRQLVVEPAIAEERITPKLYNFL
jgi:hypothetical protein